MQIDQIQLNFNAQTLTALNVILGLIMFGVALDLRLSDFRVAIERPVAFGVGVMCQFVLLPALAFGLGRWLGVGPSIMLGMILVAACPGGNVSNFFVHLGGGNTALSVCMTAVSTSMAIFMTPFNVSWWGSQNPATAVILKDFSLSAGSMLGTVMVLLGVPLVLGMGLAAKAPNVAEKLRRPFRVGSLLFFAALIAVAFRSNFDHFLSHIGTVFWPVLILNAGALSLGYGAARLARLPSADARAVSIEVGIQNSGLGLVLIFGFFEGLGGMAVVAAWWGIWHLITGLTIATVWSRLDARRNGLTSPEASVD